MTKRKKFKFPKNTPEWIQRIDFTDLRTQKTMLLETINNDAVDPEHKEGLEGILATIDALQDYAVDVLGVPEMLVFDFELEEERDMTTPTGIKAAKGGELSEGDKVKTVWLCPHCGSDNVEIKNWVNANTGEVGTDCEEDEGYCLDCEKRGELILSSVKASAEIVGFQVVGEDGHENEGDIHPLMDASFCLYSLSQAKAMLEDDNTLYKGEWKLLTLWTGDVEDATIMFEGDPRD